MKNLKRKVICICIISSVVCLLYIIFDYLNLPSRIGVLVSNLNMDLLSIIVGNVIVLAIAVTTFVLIDARNIEKDNMAKYAAASLLLETYIQIKSALIIIKLFISSEDEKEDPQNERFEQIQIDYLNTKALKYDEAIFENLNNGNIELQYYEEYIKIKTLFCTMLTCLNADFSIETCKSYFDKTTPLVESEYRRIHNYLDSFKKPTHIKKANKDNKQVHITNNKE